MKHTKRMQSNDLVVAVAGQLAPFFVAEPRAIKQGIELMMDREYLERDPADAGVLLYVA
jgi:hypothetical protein